MLLLLLTLNACDRSGRAYFAEPDPDHPGVVDLGEFVPVDSDDFADPGLRGDLILYDTIGPPPGVGEQGGATLSFLGTGGEVCVMVDPEAVFWSQSVAEKPGPDGKPYAWPDNYQDDGDLDLYVGLSAHYTGSPGVEIGDFASIYEDPLGNETEIQLDECIQMSAQGLEDGHAGRGTLEYCTVDTSLHPGRPYTVLLKTFSVPPDDHLLSYGVVVVDSSCDSIRNMDECTIPGEAPWDGFTALEDAYCNGDVADFCASNPDLCGDP